MKNIRHMIAGKLLGFFSVFVVLGPLNLPLARAATQYWDTNGNATGTTATFTGTWDAGTTSLWTSALAGDVATELWTNGNEASFSAGTNGTGLQTVTVSGNVSTSGIVIKNGTLTLNGASSPFLTIGSGGVNVTSANAGKTIFDGTLGRVNLSADQTWTAGGSSTGFTINSGITSNAASGTITLTIAGTGATATTNNAGATLVDGANAKLALTYNNSGQLTMAGINTYSGGTTLSGTSVGGTSSAVLILNTDSVGTSGNPTSGAFGIGTISLNGGLVKMRAKTSVTNYTLYNNIALASDLQFVTASSINDSSLTLAGPVTIIGSSRTINTDTSQNASVKALGIISGNIGDGGAGLGLTKTGSGTLRLSGANTYSGTTLVSLGTLLIDGSTSSSSTVTVASGGTLGGTGTVGGATTISGTHSPGNSPGIQTFGSDLTYSGGSSAVNWELKANTTTNQVNPGAIFDAIVVNGNLDFAGPTTLNLSFTPTGSNVLWSDSFWSTSKTGTGGWLIYDLIGAGTASNFTNLSLASSSWLDSGNFAFNTERPGASFGLFLSGSDIYLNYTVVPEHATWVLVFFGLALILAARKVRARC